MMQTWSPFLDSETAERQDDDPKLQVLVLQIPGRSCKSANSA